VEVEERGSNPNSLIGNLSFLFGLKDFSFSSLSVFGGAVNMQKVRRGAISGHQFMTTLPT